MKTSIVGLSVVNKSAFDEARIYEDIKTLVMSELETIKNRKASLPTDIAALEKLSRIYATLKDDLREDTKADLWKKLGVVG